jgi:hypothetical protein
MELNIFSYSHKITYKTLKTISATSSATYLCLLFTAQLEISVFRLSHYPVCDDNVLWQTGVPTNFMQQSPS